MNPIIAPSIMNIDPNEVDSCDIIVVILLSKRVDASCKFLFSWIQEDTTVDVNVCFMSALMVLFSISYISITLFLISWLFAVFDMHSVSDLTSTLFNTSFLRLVISSISDDENKDENPVCFCLICFSISFLISVFNFPLISDFCKQVAFNEDVSS